MKRQRNPQKQKHKGDTSWEGEQERREIQRERERVSAEVWEYIGTVGVKFGRVQRYIYLNGEEILRCFLYRNIYSFWDVKQRIRYSNFIN